MIMLSIPSWVLSQEGYPGSYPVIVHKTDEHCYENVMFNAYDGSRALLVLMFSLSLSLSTHTHLLVNVCDKCN